MNGQPRARLRLRYLKDDILMYIGHRDLLRFTIRMLRKAEIPFATSGQYSPKPRITFGPALPLGISASGELLDIELLEGLQADEALLSAYERRLRLASEPRDFVAGLVHLAEGDPPLSKLVTGGRYHIHVDGEPQALRDFIDRGDLTWQSQSQKTVDFSVQIIRYSIIEGGLVVDGNTGGEANLNIRNFSSLLTERTGICSSAIHRVGLLDREGKLL